VSQGGAFRGRTAGLLAGAGALSLVATVLLVALGDRFELVTAGADGFSRSAIGHRALVELWRDTGRPVVLRRHRAAQAGSQEVLVVAEPALLGDTPAGEEDEGAEGTRLEQLLEGARRALLVLPKRSGEPSALHRGWLGTHRLRPVEEAERVLQAAGLEGAVVRPEHLGAWQGGLPVPTLDAPQLVRADGLEPLLSTPEGALVARRRGPGGRELLVLSDPDVLAAHGLGRGDNAFLAVRLLELLEGLQGPGAVAVDETLHGHEVRGSLVRSLLSWPLVLATAQAVLALLLAGWAAAVRFGRVEAEPPALAAGKGFLIDNAAELLRHGGHGGMALAGYWRAAREQVARALRAPAAAGASGETLVAWLARQAAARGRAAELRQLQERVQALAGARRGAELLRVAVAVHDFREEMTHGADPHP